MKSKNKVQVNSSLRQKPSIKANNSSFEIDIIDKEIKKELLNDSGISIDQHQSAPLKSRRFSPSSDKVIINSNDQNSTISRKQRKRNCQIRKQRRKQFIYEKELINKQQLSVLFLSTTKFIIETRRKKCKTFV
ncbi:unnamed protein product [Rotaria sp. Silwood2]|nr:unnamed protein product [Rotaria sp. Silwood2]CAF3194819.1 unnamed protein product [Rotaria sp. Silwood2]CAF3323841.1 unnamed protein product [Rotaria sp. Silwood2]CAF3400834.1 unnamed protein product [Rotaria sp. Silwood2]CAF4418283.1 unnamed protein product [Rotaria sp. Silwood2]